jgi:hypothetical protein
VQDLITAALGDFEDDDQQQALPTGGDG